MPDDILTVYAGTQPDKLAVIDDKGDGNVVQWTYAEFETAANRLGNALLSLGATPGQKVVWCGPNSLPVVAVMSATRKIGVVDGMASSPFSLAEARVLYEVANREQPTATDIRKELGLDAGYISRIMRDFERRKLVTREQSKTDERQRILLLTTKGRRAFAPLNERSNRNVATMLQELSPTERKQLVDALQTVHRLLGEKAAMAPWPYSASSLAWRTRASMRDRASVATC